MKKTINIKKSLVLLATIGFGMAGLTACGNNSSLPAVEGDFGEAPKISAGQKGKEPKELKKSVLVEGKGEACGSNAILKTNYTGQLWNGKIFDSSFGRDGKDKGNKKAIAKPVVFPLSGVIKGWQDGLKNAKPGSRIELVIPPSLGYGEQESKIIPKHSTLVFVVDILECFKEKNAKNGFTQLKNAKTTGDAISGVKVEGKLGSEPKILVTDKAKLPKALKIVDLSQGNGKVIKQGDTVVYHITSKTTNSLPEQGSWKRGIYKYDAQVSPKELIGKKVGSRVMIYYPQGKQRPGVILVVDLVGMISGSGN